MALSEQVFSWEGKNWPPESIVTGDSFELEGVIEKTYPLRVRRANVQTGYLKGAQTGDVLSKVHAVVLKVTSIKLASTKTTLTFKNLTDALEPFIRQAAGSSTSNTHLVIDSQRVVFWGRHTLVGDVRTQVNASQTDPLGSGTIVKVLTQNSSLLIKELDVVKIAPPTKAGPTYFIGPMKPDVNKDVNLMDGARNTFQPTSSKPPASKPDNDVDPNEW